MCRILKNSNFNNATQLEQETISLFRISLLNLAFYLLCPTRVTFQIQFSADSHLKQANYELKTHRITRPF